MTYRYMMALPLVVGILSQTACSSGDDHNHGAAPNAGGTPGIDSGTNGGQVAVTDASASECSPACGAGEVCCTDAHGHFPKCVTGSGCP